MKKKHPTVKEYYLAAYHRIRVFHSDELYRAEDNYPIGFGCNQCSDEAGRHGPCYCQEEYAHEMDIQARVMSEAHRLLNVPVSRELTIRAAKSYAHRLEYMDYEGKSKPIYSPLRQRLRAKRKRGIKG